MNQPSLDTLMFQFDSKYTLVVVAAKRARVIMAKSAPDEFKETKPVSRALAEMAQEKLGFYYIKEGNN